MPWVPSTPSMSGLSWFGVEVITMDVRYLDFRAHEARRRWADGGGRRRLEWLRRWEVDEGREADPRGRWRVARVMDVRRPMHRHGRQLEVQVEWARSGHNVRGCLERGVGGDYLVHRRRARGGEADGGGYVPDGSKGGGG